MATTAKTNLDLKPVALIAGLVAAPIVSGAIGRTFITPKGKLKDESEVERMLRNFGIYYGLAAAGLGYAGSRKDLSQGWRNVAIGGAIGTGLIAAFIGTALVTAPTATPPEANPPPGGGGLFGPSTGNRVTAPAWTSSFIGLPR